ncbi:MAG: hypothetical protein JXR78_08540 [Victivallales bacterium]|nr:hypothetical protein [Victivallales bacterium]
MNIAHELKLPAGSIVAIDRGYLDFKLLEKWDNAGIGDEVKLIRNDDFGGLLLETERLSGDVWIAW